MSDHYGEDAEDRPGGMGKPRKPTKEDQARLDQVKPEFEKKSGMNVCTFLALSIREQIVAGTNYLYKVDVGEGKCCHLNLFQPLPYTNEGPSLVSFQCDKTKDDKLEEF